MTFRRTFDFYLVRKIITHPQIFPHVTDDFSPTAEDYMPEQSDLIWYVLVEKDQIIRGMFSFVPQNKICWEVHTTLLPEAWGALASEAAKSVSGWIWQNTPCQRIVTSVPETNRLALRLAKRAGLTQYGVNTKSILKGGRLLDQILLGVSKSEVDQCLSA